MTTQSQPRAGTYEAADDSVVVSETSSGIAAFLVGTRCRECSVLDLGARKYCANCSSPAVKQERLSGRGTLEIFSVVVIPAKSWMGNRPYVLGEVRLDEGPSIVAEVIELHGALSDLEINAPMTVALLDVELDGGRRVLVPKLVSDLAHEGAGRSLPIMTMQEMSQHVAKEESSA